MIESRPDHPTRQEELALFLRRCRERISPGDVGIATNGRRRTPGLRREEVAQLASVGLTWYTWLEQGREIDVSAHVLEQIAKGLKLDADERTHLFMLAHGRPPATRSPGDETVTLAAQAMLESFKGPAYLATACLDVIAWNRALAAVFGDLTPLPEGARNMLWLMFASPEHRAAIPDWDEAARAMVARFRREFDRNRDDRRFLALVENLREASAEFRAWWGAHDVSLRPEGQKRFSVAGVGEIVLDQHTFLWEPSPGVRLVVYSPANDDSAARVQVLCDRWQRRKTGTA